MSSGATKPPQLATSVATDVVMLHNSVVPPRSFQQRPVPRILCGCRCDRRFGKPDPVGCGTGTLWRVWGGSGGSTLHGKDLFSSVQH
jgi:hypothetical protein